MLKVKDDGQCMITIFSALEPSAQVHLTIKTGVWLPV